MRYKYIDAPATEVLSLTDVKSYLKIDHTVEDDLINSLIKSARDYVETYLNKTLLTRMLQLSFTKCVRVYTLPILPVQSITKIEYIDDDGELEVVATTAYELRANQGVLIIKDNSVFNDAADDFEIVVTCKTGYTAVDEIPEAIVQALLLIVADSYENRGNCAHNTRNVKTSQFLLNPHRNIQFS